MSQVTRVMNRRRVRPYVLAVRESPAESWRLTHYVYRSNRDTQARLWRRAGAQVRAWDVRELSRA